MCKKIWFVGLVMVVCVCLFELVETYGDYSRLDYQPCISIQEKYMDAIGYKPAQFSCNCWCQIKREFGKSFTYLERFSADIQQKAIMFDLVYFNKIDDNLKANIDPSIGKEIGFFANYIDASIEKLKLVNKLKGDHPIPKDAFYSWIHINDTMYDKAEGFTTILNANYEKIRSIKLTHNLHPKGTPFIVEIPKTTQLEQLYLDRNGMTIRLQNTIFATDPAASEKFKDRGVFIYGTNLTNSHTVLNIWFKKDEMDASVVYEPIFNGTNFTWPSFYSQPEKPVKSIALGVYPETKEVRYVNITLPKEIFQYVPSIDLLCLPLNRDNDIINFTAAVEMGALGIEQFIGRQFSFAGLGKVRECNDPNRILHLTEDIHNLWTTGLCFEIVKHTEQNTLGKYALCAYCLSVYYKKPTNETMINMAYKYWTCYYQDPANGPNEHQNWPYPMTSDDMIRDKMWKPVEQRPEYVSIWAPVAGYVPVTRPELLTWLDYQYY